VSFVRRLITHPVGPTAAAVAIALMTLPLTAFAMSLVENYAGYDVDKTHLGYGTAFGLALGAVVLSALVAGSLAGTIVRTSPSAGAAVALLLAWPTAIVGLSATASLMGHTVDLGEFCLDSCGAAFSTGEDALMQYGDSVRGFIGFTGIPALILGLIALVVGRSNRLGDGPRLAVGFTLFALAFGALNVMSIGASSFAFLVLATGVLAWAGLLRRTGRRGGVPATAPDLAVVD
jgi:hypothetical protein